MNYFKIMIMTLLLANLLGAENFIQIQSHHSVDKTIERLSALLKAKQLNVFATIDHQANAKTVNLDMPKATVVIFGNPKVGTKVMQQDITAALDLPIRVLVYETPKGTVYIRYENPHAIEKHYSIDDKTALDKMHKALANITAHVAADN